MGQRDMALLKPTQGVPGATHDDTEAIQGYISCDEDYPSLTYTSLTYI